MCSVGVKVLGCTLFANDGKRNPRGGILVTNARLFDCANAQIVFSTSAITVGVNFKRNQQSKDVELSATHLTFSER